MNNAYAVLGVLFFLVLAGAWYAFNRSISSLQDSNIPSANMKLTSSAFKEGESIPTTYTCDGQNLSPPLLFSGVPAGAKSLALVMDDPDAPGDTWDHWIVFNLPSTLAGIEEGKELRDGISAKNSWGRTGYGGPCPPSGSHRYIFILYALDSKLTLKAGATKQEVLQAIEGHILAQAKLVGRYRRVGQ